MLSEVWGDAGVKRAKPPVEKFSSGGQVSRSAANTSNRARVKKMAKDGKRARRVAAAGAETSNHSRDAGTAKPPTREFVSPLLTAEGGRAVPDSWEPIPRGAELLATSETWTPSGGKDESARADLLPGIQRRMPVSGNGPPITGPEGRSPQPPLQLDVPGSDRGAGVTDPYKIPLGDVERDYGDREYGDRDYGDREYGDRDYGDRDYGDRERDVRNYSDRERDVRDYSDRERDDRERDDRDYGLREESETTRPSETAVWKPPRGGFEVGYNHGAASHREHGGIEPRSVSSTNDIFLYVFSGLLLLFLIEQAIQLGAAIGAARAASVVDVEFGPRCVEIFN